MGPGSFSASSVSPALCTLVLLVGLAGKVSFLSYPRATILKSLKTIYVIASSDRLFRINFSGWNQRPEEDAGHVMFWSMCLSPAVAALCKLSPLPIWKHFYETLMV